MAVVSAGNVICRTCENRAEKVGKGNGTTEENRKLEDMMKVQKGWVQEENMYSVKT